MTWTWSVLKALLIWTGKMPRVRTFLHEKLPGIMLGRGNEDHEAETYRRETETHDVRKERRGEGEARTATP